MGQSGDRIDGRALRASRKRQTLLAAVIESMTTSTTFSGSLRALAADLGISHGLLVHHFGSKEVLLGEVVATLQQQQLDRLRALTDLRQFWHEISSDEHLPAYRLFFSIYGQALAEPTRFPYLTERVVADWLSTLSSHLSNRDDTAGEATELATCLIAFARGLLLDLLSTGERDRIDAAFTVFADLMDARLAPVQTPAS